MIGQLEKNGSTTRFVHWAFVLYPVSYALPAVTIAGDLVFGFPAAFFSFPGLLVGGGNGIRKRPVPCMRARYFGKHPHHIGLPLLQLAAVFANVQPLIDRGIPAHRTGCALGAAVFLATGSDTFVPHVGYVAWLASMILMSRSFSKLAKAVRS